MVIRLSRYSSQSLWWPSDYPYTHHNLPDVSDNLYTHHSLPGDTQTITILIRVSQVVLRLSIYSSQSPLWYSDYPYTHHSESSCGSLVYPYPHHILFGGTQTKPIRIIVSLVVLGISPYSPQSTVYLVAQTIAKHITVSLMVPRLSLFSSQSARWYSDYPYTHHSLTGGTQTIPLLITVCLMYSDYPHTQHSLRGVP